MPDRSASSLVSTAWLEAHLDSPDIVVVDGSLHLPTTGRNAHAEYLTSRIPGAVFFDIEQISDRSSPVPHQLPSVIQFASQMKKLGIGDGQRVVAYDSVGLYSAPRVWWMFRAMGHRDVVVLDGGLRKWIAEGRPVDDGPPARRQERHFTPRANTALVRDKADVMAALEAGAPQILDARSPGRFRGAEAEPRAGLRSGHIPGSRNVHYATLVAADGTLRPRDELAAVLAGVGVDLNRPAIASCGSGVTACVVALALSEIGAPETAIYDGSWSEWGMETAGTPIATA